MVTQSTTTLSRQPCGEKWVVEYKIEERVSVSDVARWLGRAVGVLHAGCVARWLGRAVGVLHGCCAAVTVGRFEDDFVSARLKQLQMWIDRVCKHPVVSHSEVFLHFLSCTDDKVWLVIF